MTWGKFILAIEEKLKPELDKEIESTTSSSFSRTLKQIELFMLQSNSTKPLDVENTRFLMLTFNPENTSGRSFDVIVQLPEKEILKSQLM